MNKLANIKLSTHAVMVGVGAAAFFANHLFSDPQAAEWLRAHWLVRCLYESASATLLAYGILSQPNKSN